MKPIAWRSLLLTFCAAGMLLVLAGLLDQAGMGGRPPWYGVWGGYFDGSALPYHLTFRGVDPGGPADEGGLREGDRIDVRDHTPLERLAMVGQPQAARPLTFSVERASGPAKAVVVPVTIKLSRFWNYILWEFADLWLLLFASLIAWRRPFVENNLLLASVLACAAVGFSAESLFFGLPWTWAYVALGIVSQALPLSIAMWAALASSFARPLSAVRRIALGLCYVLVAIAIVVGDGTPDRTIGIAPLVATLTLWFDPTRFLGSIWTIPADAAVLAGILCSVLAITAARGAERQRAAWLLIPLGVFFFVLGSTTLAFHYLSYSALLVVGQSYGIVAIITPLVLTYAALNRRLIDVGFVLNRTVVFAIVSTIVIGAFVLVEWAASAWLVNASHTTSVIVGMIVALGLGLSLRYIHKIVDRFVDHLLFRKRHEDESALRRFAHESGYITDAATLVERAVSTVRRHTAASSADIFVRNGSATYVSTLAKHVEVGENDPAVVALRAWNKPVDLHGIDGSALAGELAFPMMSRGQLIGALVCGPKQDGEAYAPDESAALLALALSVGGTLDVLDSKGGNERDPALVELRTNRRTLRGNPLVAGCDRRADTPGKINRPRNIVSGPVHGAKGENRTRDTALFRRVLYRLSYLGICIRLHADARAPSFCGAYPQASPLESIKQPAIMKRTPLWAMIAITLLFFPARPAAAVPIPAKVDVSLSLTNNSRAAWLRVTAISYQTQRAIESWCLAPGRKGPSHSRRPRWTSAR